jgi:hypothetical protein
MSRASTFRPLRWLSGAVAGLMIAGSLFVLLPASAAAEDHGERGRHRAGWDGHHRSGWDGHHRSGWDGSRHRSWGYHHGHHRYRHHSHHGFHSGIVWHFHSAPPPRRVVVMPPPVIVHQVPRVIIQEPPPYCREYTSNVDIGGRLVQTYGTACLQPDGSWRIVSQN